MNWRRVSARESRIQDARGATVSRVWLAAAGWIGSVQGKQSGVMEDESAAREWAEVALLAA